MHTASAAKFGRPGESSSACTARITHTAPADGREQSAVQSGGHSLCCSRLVVMAHPLGAEVGGGTTDRFLVAFRSRPQV